MLLKNLELFLLIVEKGGLSAAGRELGLSPASVSERLAQLEGFYGASLLNRTTRAINLTDEGRLLVEGARRLLAEADELHSSIRLGTHRICGPIRLSAPEDLGRQLIEPILAQFMEEHPDVSIDLNLSDGYVDPVSQGIDFAVRYGALADSRLHARPMGENRRVLCASPGYLELNGTPLHPEDLTRHECLVMRFGINISREWTFKRHGHTHRIMVHGRRVANDGALVRQWCLAGHGICLKSIWDVSADLNAGRLVELLEDYDLGSTALNIVYPPTRVQPRRVRMLIERIVAQLSSADATSVSG
ncbi:LysR family transcriptional regulator [Pseudomonas sp. BCA14]|uniref:LysR family transcriptional regulator n=1 Tax=unclassified Pseudomonas TaxID=196821 RepID=UPI00106EED5A|nr:MULTISPECIES: LysR family transcriptional regulator [unclassified Pseudomonas]TFF14580.1 LysR family transcriptional regulator [Pseudomonas sp. JMN1]TFF14736.1 LysR family transcriptional regulator [Pseudomonas sp. BCA17]TFF21519.1 LysR family transcriptional regulator [Pseudomonas sp. BCA13]TFF31142.1 LysR family transcriptional regulator [Pseudomonas sp. BCA14]